MRVGLLNISICVIFGSLGTVSHGQDRDVRAALQPAAVHYSAARSASPPVKAIAIEFLCRNLSAML